jgi:LuxR family maltose regulon positive regulatory protein
MLEASRGNTHRALALSGEALAIAKEVGLLAHPSTAEAYLTASLVALERGEPGRASLSLHEGILRADANRRSQLSWLGHLEEALLQEADGKREQAMTTVLSARSDLGAPPPPFVADRLFALRARLLRLGGVPEEGQRRLTTTPSGAAVLDFERGVTALTLGQYDVARKLIDTFSNASDSSGPLAIVERLLLTAWLADGEGRTGESRSHLREAIEVAEGNSLVEAFVRAGPKVIQMVSDLPDSSSAFRQQILRRAQAKASPSPASDLVEPLTDRELEILSYLPSRLTNTELADHFYVSVNTIKTHTAHIYRKLTAANRNDAISRARRLGLL